MISRSPATGEWLGEVPVTDASGVKAAVQAAHMAQQSWALLSVAERCRRIKAFRDVIVRDADEIVELLSAECGKPRVEALMHEVMPAVDQLTYFAEHAPSWLGRERIALHMLKYRGSYRYYAPLGVIAVIAPWNYPFVIPMGDIACGLIAGNAVVLKPSEITPMVGLKIKEFYDRSGLPSGLFQVVTGGASVGQALIDSGVNKVVFTGSVNAGRSVALACAKQLIPCTLELGGKAAAIICEDADLEQASKSVVWGGFANSGQICMSVERVYAHASVYDGFVGRVVELTGQLRQGDPSTLDVELGSMTFPRQLEVVDSLIADAVQRGAVIHTGGKRRDGQGMFFEPTVLGDCTQQMRVMREEIFGPVIPIMKVQNDDEALQRTNDSELGLMGYVFCKDRAKARRMAEQVRAGVVMINGVLEAYACPEAPFGGVKHSGYGRVHGKEGMRALCEVRHINHDRVRLARSPFAFPYSPRAYRWAQRFLRWWF